ncbi:helix-turn-helix domain-containing protein [Dinghuibacter silviterrae]|uniref:AraC family transcriptional regulator n=1 Tax=Dinghuibacter silviterrae TaxID=1539049 RepID=A0A4R8DVS8_9BACT|nr:AraC family transcriptional regulator [Dinghuibacter silviterrae]TDX02156.1 AraC family transcriptional regulator [Dinghuibacter silviterrae]
MIRENLHKPFSIEFLTVDEGPGAPHHHSFFELVYIVKGAGIQCINKSQFKYGKGHMFLITPTDCHAFEVTETTTFFFLRFNDIYVQQSGLSSGNIQNLEFILQNANHKPGCILKNAVDKKLVEPLVDAVLRENESPDLYNQELIHHFVNTLIVLVARNIAKFHHLDLSDHTHQQTANILHFIQANIYNPDRLRTEYLCSRFNISVNYLGKYFKQQTGSTLQRYITGYRQSLIEHRLIHSDKRLGEIADEFGFTDESHLTKFFKNNKGVSPKAFRANKVIS